MRYLLFCLLLSLSSCNPLTKAANTEVALLQQKQELEVAISSWYSKQIDECLSSTKAYMISSPIKDYPVTDRIPAVKEFLEKCTMNKERLALKAVEIIDSINEEDKAAHMVLIDVMAGRRSRAELMLMPAKILPKILQLKALVGEIGIDMDRR